MIRSFARPLISQLQTKKDLKRARESSAVVFVGMYDQSPASDAAIEVHGLCVVGGGILGWRLCVEPLIIEAGVNERMIFLFCFADALYSHSHHTTPHGTISSDSSHPTRSTSCRSPPSSARFISRSGPRKRSASKTWSLPPLACTVRRMGSSCWLASSPAWRSCGGC